MGYGIGRRGAILDTIIVSWGRFMNTKPTPP
jgi:hypothetical protein